MKEITEDYVGFETAKLLNEKGFKQECDYATSWYAKQYYKNSCQGEWFEGEHQIIEDIDDKCNISYLSDKNIFIPAPTLQMAMKWLREEHKLFIDITAAMEDYIEDGAVKYKDPYYTWEVFSIEIGETLCFGEAQNVKKSYEEACEAAIKYCLENLI